ncbi:hypothetical protein HBO32_26360 [Pseudomonas nitroreducens]|uniref:toxin-antitoxin system YwqK family antitoxin n=1 Tax=Pseudomonas TaxID=286 RepID=UPI000807F8D1|nr:MULTISPECIES: hypothetical protein [Pseudomonas]NMZ76646.1 hypothetical protein [Pseudomonas nitroreducens]OBY57460.1 hypothetical protein A9513_003095 [Pseudomonas sp. AU12215]
MNKEILVLENTRRSFALSTIAIAALSLSGCFDEEVDARQTQDIQGLIYKVHADDPFTGRVLNYPMNFLGVISLGSCAMDIKKGLPDGEVICSDNNGKVLATGEFSAGKRNGKDEKFDPASGKKTFSGNWANGLQDGLQEQFSPKTGEKILEAHYTAGKLDGRERAWDDSGKTLIADLEWTAGKRTGFDNRGTQMRTYLNDQLHGTQKTLSIADGHFYIESEQHYFNGVQDGVQKKFTPKGEVTELSVFENGKIRSRTIDKYSYSTGKREHHVNLLALSDDVNQYMDSDMSKDGEEQYWDDNGNVIRELQWDKGRLIKATATVWAAGNKDSEYQGVTIENYGPTGVVKDGHERLFDNKGELKAIIVWKAGVVKQLLLTLPPELSAKYPGKVALIPDRNQWPWPVRDERDFEEASTYFGDRFVARFEQLVDMPAPGQVANAKSDYGLEVNTDELNTVASAEASNSDVDACVQKKSDAVHAENTEALVTHDMLEEFTQECQVH